MSEAEVKDQVEKKTISGSWLFMTELIINFKFFKLFYAQASKYLNKYIQNQPFRIS